ncbi:hypothetical protein HZB60_00490 [candidate division KSB1 bacterium]|nr:hypothetical protein [candidate division KSB1 bacterium]
MNELLHITVMEPVTGRTFPVEVPRGADIAELRRRIAAALAVVMETYELYSERTGRLLPRDPQSPVDVLSDGEILTLLSSR